MNPTMFMLVGIGCLGAGLFVVIGCVGSLTKETATAGVNRSLSVLQALTAAPKEMKAELEPAFVDRVLVPLLARVKGITGRLTPDDANDRVRAKLDLAGNPEGLTVERVNGLKVLGFVAGLLASGLLSLLMELSMTPALLFVVGASLAGCMAPNMYLYQRSFNRTDDLRRAPPDVIDLLTISVESGLDFDAAVSQVARNTKGALADEFARMLQEMQIGRGRSEALRSLADRTNLPELRSFVSALVQADAFGIPIRKVLRVQSQRDTLEALAMGRGDGAEGAGQDPGPTY